MASIWDDQDYLMAVGAGLLSGRGGKGFGGFAHDLGNALMGGLAARQSSAKTKAIQAEADLKAQEYQRRMKLMDELSGGGAPSGGLLGGSQAPAPGGLLSPSPGGNDLAGRYNIPPDAIRFGALTKDPAQFMAEAIQKSTQPHWSNGIGYAWNPQTRGYDFIGGAVGPNTFPVANQGGQLRAQPIQGLSDAIASQEGARTRATESAKAELDLVDVPMGGRVVKMTRAEAARILGQQQAPQSAPPQIPSAVIDAERNGRPFVATVQPGGQPMFSYPSAPLGQSLTKAEEAAQVGRVNTGIEATKGLNEDFVKNSYRPVMDAGKQAESVLNRVEALQKSGILNSTGWGTTQKAYAASVLGALGVKDASKYAADSETFRKLLMDTNWELLNAAKGPQTEGDAQRALQTFVQLGNRPEANKFILDYTAAAARLAKQRANHYATAVQGRGADTDLAGIEKSWGEKAPSLWDMPEMKKWANGGDAAPNKVTLPGGKVMTFPSEAAARAFKKQAGL